MDKEDVETVRRFIEDIRSGRPTSKVALEALLSFERIVKQPPIVITLRDGIYEADRPSFPGSPICGHGRTWRAALGDLMMNDPKSFGLDTVNVVNKDGTSRDKR